MHCKNRNYGLILKATKTTCKRIHIPFARLKNHSLSYCREGACGEEVDPTLGWCLTYPLNFSEHPAASIPAGLSLKGLPIGMQDPPLPVKVGDNTLSINIRHLKFEDVP